MNLSRLSTRDLRHRLDTATAYQTGYMGRSTSEPLIERMRAENDAEIEALTAELARREGTS